MADARQNGQTPVSERSRDQLEADVRDLERRVENMEGALRNLASAVTAVDADTPVPPAMAQVSNVLEATIERSKDAEDAAELALSVAEAQAPDEEETTKKRVALLTSRNEVVRRALKDWPTEPLPPGTPAGGRPPAARDLPISKVQTMCKPEVKVYHQTVLDAWDELVENWNGLSVHKKDRGDKRVTVLRAEAAELDRDLVRAVEHALDASDLTKRLHSAEVAGGGEE